MRVYAPRGEPHAYSAVILEDDLGDGRAHEHAAARTLHHFGQTLGDARGPAHRVPPTVLHVCGHTKAEEREQTIAGEEQ